MQSATGVNVGSKMIDSILYVNGICRVSKLLTFILLMIDFLFCGEFVTNFKDDYNRNKQIEVAV